MNLFTKRAALLGAAIIGTGAIASLTTGATFALFSASATTDLTQTYAAGTVSLSSSATHSVSLSNLVPGDCSYQGNAPYTWTSLYYSGTPLCGADLGNTDTYVLTYTGSAPAFVGVDLTFSSTAANDTALPLWDPLNSNGGLEVRVGVLNSFGSLTDILDIGGAGNVFSTGEFAANDLTCSGTPTTCTATIDNIEIPVGSTTDYGNTNWVNGDSQTLYVDWLFHNGTNDNQFQGGTATVTVHGHAVQAGGGNTTLVNTSATVGFAGGANKCDSANGTSWNSTPANPTQSYAVIPQAAAGEFVGGLYACPGSWS
ncbi:MAG: TasA family protein [Candidatus Dormibacteria bacterium]|jgi:hypothetical protein